MKKLRILVLVHEDLLAPESLDGLSDEEVHERKTEYDVVSALEEMGHEVRQLGVRDELRPIRESVGRWKPDIVFNLLEEFQGEAIYDQNVVSYLELLRVPYTGCNPRGLVLARDKALSKQLVAYHRIRAPRFAVFRDQERVRRPRGLEFPLIVKSLVEEGSAGIAKASVVDDDEKLAERIAFVRTRLRTDAIAEEFVSGRELYVGILGNQRLRALRPLELVVKKAEPGERLLATARAKHDPRYQVRRGVDIVRAQLSADLARRLASTARRVYRALRLDGYARIDFRLDAEERIFFLEANPNPDIARYEEMAASAEAVGISYESLLQRIMSLGLRR